VVISMFILKGDTFLLSCVVMLTIPLVGLYDNFKSPQLMEASDRLLDFNVKIMTRIEEVCVKHASRSPRLKHVVGLVHFTSFPGRCSPGSSQFAELCARGCELNEP